MRLRALALTIAMFASHGAIGRLQGQSASWLDAPKPTSWNAPGLAIPAAPRVDSPVDQRCRALARPPQMDEDARVRNQGWDLVDAFQGGWQVLLVRGTAGYDGMCRPLQYRDFVFARGVF